MYSSISGLTCIEFLLLLSATLDQPSMRLAARPPPSPRRRPPRHFASHCCATQLRIRWPQHPPAPARPLRRSSRIHRAHPLDPCCIPPACLLRTGPALSEWFIQTDVPLLGLFWLNPYAILGCPTRFPDRASTTTPRMLRFEPDTLIHTDGSKIGTSLSATVFPPARGLRWMFRLADHDRSLNTVLRAELAAIHIALRDIPASEDITLLTDSQSSIHLLSTMLSNPQSLSRHKHRWLLSEIAQTMYSRSAPTAIHKVRGHTGSFGNTIVDKLAKAAHTNAASQSYTSSPSHGRGVFWPQYPTPLSLPASPAQRDVDDLRTHPRKLARAAHSTALLHTASGSTIPNLRNHLTQSPASVNPD